MTKEQVIKGCIKLIEKIAKEKELEVENLGTGHGFEGSFWEGMAKDISEIPTINAKSADYEIGVQGGYKIGLRPFWSSPEICIRRDTELGEELLIFTFSDSVKNRETDHYDNTGDFKLHEIRVDVRSDYKACINEVYEMIEFVEKAGLE